MTSRKCARAWAAGAIADGRLDAEGKASFARHAAQCAECAEEARAIAELASVLSEREPRRLSPMEVKRQRAELLRRANEEAVSRVEPRRLPVLPIAAAALVMVAGVAFVVSHERRAVASAHLGTPSFDLRPVGAAEYRDESRGSLGDVVLSRGTLAVHVEHLRDGQRFVLHVPDGELEVRGTRFIVAVAGGHTEYVLVTEGFVAVHLSGTADRVLTAGERLDRPLPAPAREPSDASPPMLADTTEASASPAAPLRRSPRGGERPAASRGAPAPPAPEREEPASRTAVDAPSPAPARDTAATEFAGAMTAFEGGALLEADERLAAFSVRFPGDARTEDASFLRAVIAARRGDTAAAGARARDYLRRYPHGLRRKEAERIAGAEY